MEWYVFRYNINSSQIEHFNIFNHYGFSNDFSSLKNKGYEREKFEEELDKLLMYYFWCRYEYETTIGEYSDRPNRAESRTDIYEQIRMNWRAFVDYALGIAPPCRIGDKLWVINDDGAANDVTVRMMTQRSDRTWKIRVKGEIGILWDIDESEIGVKYYRDKEAADQTLK